MGGSESAINALTPHVDVYMRWGELLKETAAFMSRMRAGAARPSASRRRILAATDGAAWNRARAILERVLITYGVTTPAPMRHNIGSNWLVRAAAEAELHDTCVWTALAVATRAPGNSSALVGSPETVAKALLEYYKLGASSVLIRGYDPRPDAIQYGEELIPRVRKLVAQHDQVKASVSTA